MKIALYPGTFDPVTNGHLDIMRQALTIFDHMVVNVAGNVKKTPLFPLEERMEMIRRATGGMEGVQVASLDGLSVEAARHVKATALIRGIRTVADFENECRMTLMNRQLAPDITTLFLMTSGKYAFISSSLVKEVARFGGDIGPFVPPGVQERLTARLRR